MRIRSTLTIAIVLYLTLGSSAGALAACDAPPDLQASVETADTVFVAQVTSVSDRGATAQATVKAIWKGPDLPRTVTLSGGDGSDVTSGMTRIHEVGQTYLVVTSWSRSAFVDDKCTATRIYQGLPSEIPRNLQEAVGTDQARLVAAPATTEAAAESGNGMKVFIVVGVMIVLGLSIAVMVERLARFEPRQPESADEPPAPEKKQSRKERKQRKRLVAGWSSGRFSRSGNKKLRKLKKG